ncbi:hypothetical protein GCM10022222_08760 [Amycolatopsis ultiminotia]|uniref:Uncharacterized protein n=1 Tax=Amycolatopsis ultiminotia TaxID=543629 RepID=A0ABP6V3Z7_9PSEU
MRTCAKQDMWPAARTCAQAFFTVGPPVAAGAAENCCAVAVPPVVRASATAKTPPAINFLRIDFAPDSVVNNSPSIIDAGRRANNGPIVGAFQRTVVKP